MIRKTRAATRARDSRFVGAGLLLLAFGCGHRQPATPQSGSAATAAEVSGTTTATVAPAAHLSALPPLIDREVFFDDPEIAGAQISPDGKIITFRKPYKNVMNIWWKKAEEPFEAARPLTADTARPVKMYFWSEDSKYVLYAQDKGGDENYRIYAVDPTGAVDGQTGVPAARDLTPYNDVRAVIYDVPERTPGSILIGLNDRDPQLHDLYRLDLKTGKRALIRKNDSGVVGWVFDLKGTLRLGIRLDKAGGTEIVRVQGNRLSPVYTCTAEESCSPVRFHKDGRRVYLITNKGSADLARLVLFDPATRKEEPVDSDPENQVDIGDLEFSDATEELVATVYEAERMRLYPKTPEFARDWEILRKALPEGDLHIGSGTEDDSLRLVSLDSDVDPGATYLYDRKAGKVTFLYRPYPRLPVKQLAHMKPVRYKARDGLDVPAYLTVPKGVAIGAGGSKLPAVVLPHGGPWARDSWGYDPLAQFLANRGYVVLQPNFRGSTGYGKKFLNLGNKQWGTGTMQHDISDGVAWLVQQGIADPARVGIAGGSYGGFATLAGLAFTPQLYAAGVDIVGPSSIPTLLGSIPPYWAPLVKIFHVRVGDPADPQDAERLKSQSPLHSATNIKAPLLIIQGANDPRVKQSESDQIVTALRDLGRQVEYVVAPDEGHGFAGKENRLAMYAGMERFLARHLGGRAQTSMAPPIAERLAKLTVDVKTVKKPAVRTEPRTALAATTFTGEGGLLPLKASTLRYAQKVQMGGKLLEARSVLQVGPGRDSNKKVWVVEEKVESAMGNGSDRTLLDPKTLLPLRRTMEQGPARIELAFADTSVKGNVKMAGQEIPINAKIARRVLTEGAPLNQALRTLPLASGYTSTLSTFDHLSGSAKDYKVTVKAAEQVEVPAGKFDAFRVELAPADGSPGGSTVWIESAATRRVIKAESKLPAQAGGGTATSELVGEGSPS